MRIMINCTNLLRKCLCLQFCHNRKDTFSQNAAVLSDNIPKCIMMVLINFWAVMSCWKKNIFFCEIHFMSPKCAVFQPWSLRTLIKFLYSRSHFSLSLLSHFCIYLTYPFYQRTAGLVSQNNQVLLDKITLHRQSK